MSGKSTSDDALPISVFGPVDERHGCQLRIKAAWLPGVQEASPWAGA